MARLLRNRTIYRYGVCAWLLACCWLLFLPATASAHALLLRANPPLGAVLKDAPTQVRLWFSEDLNPAFTTAYVVDVNKYTTQSLNDASLHVDKGDAHVAADDAKEIDLSLQTHLPPAVYLVFYRAESSVDGHLQTDSFFFTIERPDGTVPAFTGSLPVPPVEADPSLSALEGSSAPATLFNVLITTLIEIALVFWLGAQLWSIFVFELTETENPQLRTLFQEIQQHFEQRLSLPLLWTLLLAHIGILVDQALVIVNGSAQSFSFSLLSGQLLHGQFGLYWMIREGILILALIVGYSLIDYKKIPLTILSVLRWINLLAGIGLLAAMTLSGHAAAVDNDLFLSSVLSDGLHILAAALWVGGMFYLAAIVLPVLNGRTLQERTWALLSTLPHYSPLAIVGVIIMATSGTSNASLRLPAWSELFTTTYGYILLCKIVLVGGLLLTSALHVFWLRPRLKKTYHLYADLATGTHTTPLFPDLFAALLPPLAFLEEQLQRQCSRLVRILRWEPLLGLAVLLCTALLNVFSGTLQPVDTSQVMTESARQLQVAGKKWEGQIATSDGLFTLLLTVSPDHQGPNEFTVRILRQPGTAQNTIKSMVISTTLPAMDMGTTTINLQPGEHATFSAIESFSMVGRWRVQVAIYTADNHIHTASILLPVP
ncbi:MAG TPA: CopD family protein [Ktedonobacteraceae bacterium]|nr:CopD family protein [Ktedonobacteraceae bacterium]